MTARVRFDRLLAAAPTVGVALLVAWFALQAVRLSAFGSYSIDEYQYGHAAWLISNGQVPYRDFFAHHFPLSFDVLALGVLVVGDAAASFSALRWFTLPWVILIGVGVAFLGGGPPRTLRALLRVAILLAIPIFAKWAVQIRPDVLGTALFVTMVVLLVRRDSSRWHLFVAGILLVASIWSSEKAGIYAGGLFAAALAVDLLVNRRRGTERLIRHPLAMIGGGFAAGVPILILLTVTGSWGAWYEWTIGWAMHHQRVYPGFWPLASFIDLVFQSSWVLALAGVGVVNTIRAIWSKRAWSDPDVLLLIALATTLASFWMQTAAFHYSMIPFLPLLAVFASRGVMNIFDVVSERARFRTAALVGASLLLAAGFFTEYRVIARSLAGDNNRYQREVLALLDELTGPADPVYDNAGGFFSRPHVHFLYFTDALIRRDMADKLSREIPEGIRAKGCTAYLHSFRDASLPDSLKEFLSLNYQPVNGDLSLWGRRYVLDGGPLNAEFEAVRDDEYFIEPASVLDEGEVTIDGRPVTSRIFKLDRGIHTITYEGPVAEVYVLWLPRNREPYRPVHGLTARFTTY